LLDAALGSGGTFRAVMAQLSWAAPARAQKFGIEYAPLGIFNSSRTEVRVAAPTPESHSPEPMLADICLTWIIAKERT